MRIINFILKLFVTAFLLAISGCGGGEKSTSAKTGGDGRIFLKNQTQATLTTSYFNEDDQKTVEVEVKPNETKDVSQAVLKNASKVKIHVVASGVSAATSGASRVETDIEVIVDGNRTIVVKQTGSYGNPSWEYDILGG